LLVLDESPLQGQDTHPLHHPRTASRSPSGI
jgi:hypothetical protein